MPVKFTVELDGYTPVAGGTLTTFTPRSEKEAILQNGAD
jgi:hypothetical protein